MSEKSQSKSLPLKGARFLIVGGASHRDFALMQRELTACGEDAAIDLVGRGVLGVIALQRIILLFQVKQINKLI